jgi:hypothetical protein
VKASKVGWTVFFVAAAAIQAANRYWWLVALNAAVAAKLATDLWNQYRRSAR